MKTPLTIIAILWSFLSFSQCRDAYGNNVECPTENDSLALYNNALKVFNFYENNRAYIKTRSQEVLSNSEREGVFDMLYEARRMFSVIRREVAKIEASKFSVGKTNKKYKDITYAQYYQYIDEYRFYQRELENQIVNSNAPVPIYDVRICPIVVNEYKCIDSSSEYYGDIVNLPLYVPVTVKPYMLLTADELLLRNQILHIIPKIDSVKKKEPPRRFAVKREYKIEYGGKVVNGYPVYAINEYGSGALIGFMVNGKFRKIHASEYTKYAVPVYAQKILEDDEVLNKLLQVKFGGYYKGLL